MLDLLSILSQEVKPALGCTGPTSVSFAVSVACNAIGGHPKFVKVLVDRDTYKNSVSVGIPGTDKRGLVIAASLGALFGDSAAGLEVLKNVRADQQSEAEAFAQDAVSLDIKWDYAGVGLYIEAVVETENGSGRAIIAKTHTNTILIEANGTTIYQAQVVDQQEALDHHADPIRQYSVEDLYLFSRTVPLEKLDFLQVAITMNRALAYKGMQEKIGIGYGPALSNILGDTAIAKAKSLSAAAADARMAGYNLPAMSCASSGNVGIAASVPLMALAETYDKSREELLRAICLSYLLTINIKSHIGRLSAMCACAIAASIGVAAGTSSLLGGTWTDVENAICNVAGSIGGVICDGAKSGCALKLSMATGVAIESAYLALAKVSIPKDEGFVAKSADDTIAFLGIVASQGMIETDKTVCQAIIGREKK